jgi:hypothetical protein
MLATTTGRPFVRKAAQYLPKALAGILGKDGALDTVICTQPDSADERTYEWLKTATWNDFSRKQDAGLSIALQLMECLYKPVNILLSNLSSFVKPVIRAVCDISLSRLRSSCGLLGVSPFP